MSDKQIFPRFTLKDFSNLDNSEHADYLIASMEAHYRSVSMLDIKSRAIEAMEIKENDAVIEVGCGLGLDCENMAAYVGVGGKVIGVDNSARMITEAKRRTHHSNVAYLKMDAGDLIFSNNTFSAGRADRLLVSQNDPAKIIQELKRVVKPHGKIAFTCLDLTKMELKPYCPKITEAILTYWQNLVLNPAMAQKLPQLIEENGLSILNIQPEFFSLDNYQHLLDIVPFESMVESIIEMNIVTANEGKQFIDFLRKADAEGKFYWGIPLVTVLCEKED